ncbi:D-glucosaminate-6-phosphate ammonia-lyase [Bradyrhizobium sp. USDA 3397]
MSIRPEFLQECALSERDHGRGWIYRKLGVEPFIQCAGVRTNYGGSNPSDEVIAAMNAAAQAFVDLDELAEAAGERIAELAGAEWGVITAGTAAALALATAACIAGNNPELMLRLPDTSGLRNKALIPSDQRFAYEQPIRIAGAEIVNIATTEELALALDGSVAMICLLGRMDAASVLPLSSLLPLARAQGVPILVDAAGLSPEKPDRWIENGADLVVYAGGKYIRGPQSTAIVLGKERLCKAIWWNAAPHQAFGRPMKVGKEEVVGAVLAFDRWINFQSAKEERDQWLLRLKRIESYLRLLPGVTTEVLSWAGFATAVRLKVIWDPGIIPFDAEDLRLALLQQRPRILIHDFWSTPTSIILDPVNFSDDEAEIVGRALATAFRKPQSIAQPACNLPAEVNFSGNWRAEMQFLHGSAIHEINIQQNGELVSGVHHTASSSGVISGEVRGRHIQFEAVHHRVPISLFYGFDGEFAEDGSISGKVRLGGTTKEHLGPVFKGQYGFAEWHATHDRIS